MPEPALQSLIYCVALWAQLRLSTAEIDRVRSWQSPDFIAPEDIEAP